MKARGEVTAGRALGNALLRDLKTRLPKPQAKGRALPRAKSQLEELLWCQFQAEGISARAIREYKFAPARKWRFDFAFPHAMLSVECDGGSWRQSGKGAHTGGAAQTRDNEKGNTAVELGWRVLHYDLKVIKSGEALAQIVRILGARMHPDPR